MATPTCENYSPSENPARTETTVLTKSARRCTLCCYLFGDLNEKLGQIAYLDQNRANNKEENLAFMCLEHHSIYGEPLETQKWIP